MRVVWAIDGQTPSAVLVGESGLWSVRILVAGQLAMARRAHAHITEVRAPHLSMISAPDVVTRVITQAARASG